jgi:hypothetical protein
VGRWQAHAVQGARAGGGPLRRVGGCALHCAQQQQHRPTARPTLHACHTCSLWQVSSNPPPLPVHTTQRAGMQRRPHGEAVRRQPQPQSCVDVNTLSLSCCWQRQRKQRVIVFRRAPAPSASTNQATRTQTDRHALCAAPSKQGPPQCRECWEVRIQQQSGQACQAAGMAYSVSGSWKGADCGRQQGTEFSAGTAIAVARQ